MLRLDADKTVEFCDGTRRRDFLHVGSLSLLGLGMSEFLQMRAQAAVTDTGKDINVIMLMLVGGPSQLDTFDMKPEAPIEIRGPHNPIKTNVPGIEICEIFGSRSTTQKRTNLRVHGSESPNISVQACISTTTGNLSTVYPEQSDFWNTLMKTQIESS